MPEQKTSPHTTNKPVEDLRDYAIKTLEKYPNLANTPITMNTKIVAGDVWHLIADMACDLDLWHTYIGPNRVKYRKSIVQDLFPDGELSNPRLEQVIKTFAQLFGAQITLPRTRGREHGNN